MSKGRKSTGFWRDQDQAFYRYARRPLRQYVKYARRFAGDAHEIPYAAKGDGADGEEDRPALANLLTLATRVMRSELFFRNPRFLVRPPGAYNRTVFTPLLARIETVLLNDFADETHLFLEMRKSLLDGILGPYMVGKVTFDFDLAVDDSAVRKGREEAAREDVRFITAEIAPRLKDTDHHAAHIEQHEVTLARMQRGDIPVPDSAIRYMQKHIKKHREAMPWCRVTETMRNQSVHFRRINPILYGFDVFNERQPTWQREEYLARIEDLKALPDASPKALSELQEVRQQYATGEHLPRMPYQYDLALPDPLARVREYVDLVDEQVVLIAEGGTVPIHVLPYTMAKLNPSGPYVVSSFLEHPLHAFGICIPYITEAHAEKSQMLAGINSETVERSLPVQWLNGRALTAEKVAEIRSSGVGDSIVFDNVPEGLSGSDLIGNVEPVEVPAQNIAMESYHRMMFEIHYGGSSKMGGGDHSRTATASEVTALSNNALSDEVGALLDDHSRRIGVSVSRHQRTFYDQAKVVDIYGEEALEPGGWPLRFADRDILMDRAIGVVPGSSRRNNTAVETKILQDTYALVAADPSIAPELKVEVLRRLMEANGIFGLDYDGQMDHVVQQLLMEAEMGGDAMGGGMGGPPQQRLAEAEEPSMSSQAQGVANVGGGRAGKGNLRSDLQSRRREREAANA